VGNESVYFLEIILEAVQNIFYDDRVDFVSFLLDIVGSSTHCLG
jgi:hypothetical protein